MSVSSRDAGAFKPAPSHQVEAMAIVNAPAAERVNPRRRALGVLRNVPGPLIGLIVIAATLSVLSPYFLTVQNYL